MKDALVNCNKCGGNAAYETKVGTLTTWLCMGCGFISNDMMLDKSDTEVKYSETLPELYKDLRHVDSKGFVWYPSTLNVPDRGMVFINGSSKEDWLWAGVLATPLTETDIESKKFPEGTTHKMDMKTMKPFEQGDFMDAIEYIGLI
jgi:hypothetical protein